jgi:hypothetical protein
MTKIRMKVENCPEIREALRKMPMDYFSEVTLWPTPGGNTELVLSVRRKSQALDAYELFASELRKVSTAGIVSPVIDTGKVQYEIVSANSALVAA